MSKLSLGICFSCIGMICIIVASVGIIQEKRRQRVLKSDELNQAYDYCYKTFQDEFDLAKCFGKVEQYYLERTPNLK